MLGLVYQASQMDGFIASVMITVVILLVIGLSCYLLRVLFSASLLKKMGKAVNPLIYVPLCNEIGMVKAMKEEPTIQMIPFELVVDKNLLFVGPLLSLISNRLPKVLSTLFWVVGIFISYAEYKYIYELYYKEDKTGLAIVSAIFPIVYLVELIIMERNFETAYKREEQPYEE